MRTIAVLSHEVEKPELDLTFEHIERYSEFMAGLGFKIDFTSIGTLDDIGMTDIQEPREDGTFAECQINWMLYTIKYFSTYRSFVEGYTDIMLIIGRKLMLTDGIKRWHVTERGGEGYGLSKHLFDTGGYVAITTHPVERLNQDDLKRKHLDYIIRHEFGHVFIPIDDLERDAEDCIMKPIHISNPHYLKKKNIDYTDEDLRNMRSNLTKQNVDTIHIHVEEP